MKPIEPSLKEAINSKDFDFMQALVNIFGHDSQIEMIIEECTELIMSLQKLKRAKASGDADKQEKALDNVHEELADVSIMLAQAVIIFDTMKVDSWVDIKIKRMMERG